MSNNVKPIQRRKRAKLNEQMRLVILKALIVDKLTQQEAADVHEISVKTVSMIYCQYKKNPNFV